MKFWQALAVAVVLGGTAPVAIAQEPPETFDEPAVVEEEPLFFDVTLGPQLGAYVPLGGGTTVVPLVGFEATKYVAWPLYLGASAYAGPMVGVPGVNLFAFGGAKAGLLVRVRQFSLEPGVVVGAAFGGRTPSAFSPAVLPDLTVHWDLAEDFTLRTGLGYLFTPSLAGMSGPLARIGMSF
jgi:hypothetical protein